MTSEPTLTYALIALNVIVFLGGALSGGAGGAGNVLIDEGAVSRIGLADGEIWRVLTSGFLHAGLFHLFTNMFSLYILGGLIEPVVGRLRFALVYFVSLLAGSFGALLLTPAGRTVGASGAIFGLMGATFIVLRNRGINPMESGLGLWLGLNLAITFLIPGISIGGHLGGLAGGALAAVVLFELPSRARGLPRVLAPALVVVLGALAVTGSIAVSTALGAG